jgi:hypothetical protein
MRKPSTELRPRLTPQVEKQLAGIQPSVWESMKYFPCSAILKSGERLDRVYLVSQAYFVRYWGIYPEDAPGKLHVSIQDVVNVEESPSRLPATLANKLYRAGESGMGYTVFTVVFRDGSRQAYVTGGAVDFIDCLT